MGPPLGEPAMMLEARVRRVTGNCVHRLGMPGSGTIISGFARLRIEAEPPGFVMIYMDEAGNYLNDSWHASIEEAKAQAKFEFEIEDEDWVERLL